MQRPLCSALIADDRSFADVVTPAVRDAGLDWADEIEPALRKSR